MTRIIHVITLCNIVRVVSQHAFLLPVLAVHLRFHKCLDVLEDRIQYHFKDRGLLQVSFIIIIRCCVCDRPSSITSRTAAYFRSVLLSSSDAVSATDHPVSLQGPRLTSGQFYYHHQMLCLRQTIQYHFKDRGLLQVSFIIIRCCVCDRPSSITSRTAAYFRSVLLSSSDAVSATDYPVSLQRPRLTSGQSYYHHETLCL